MIYSKSSLQVVQIVEPDKEVPAFNTITFLEDGGIVAGNKKIFFWVSSLPADYKKNIPIDEGTLPGTITFWADSIKNVIRAIPRDTQFKGLLEHCDISLHNDGKYYATINDGMSTHKIELRESTEHLEGWQEIYQDFTKNLTHIDDIIDYERVFYVTMNRKRLVQMLQVLEKVIAYDGNFAPVHIYFSLKNDLLIRCKNELNEQRVCIISTTQEGDDYSLSTDESILMYGEDINGDE